MSTLIAIGLDSADPHLLDTWARSGRLPNLARLREQAAYWPLRGPDLHLSEQAWTLVATGRAADRTGYWSRWKFDPGSYGLHDTGAYDYAEHPPFYALGTGYRCAIFDVPQMRLRQDVDGIQVLAWGARSARTGTASDPPDLLPRLVARHGRHPALDRDHASHWNPLAVARLEWALREGAARRAAICVDLLHREPWDLFFTAFGETHSAGHFLWHRSQDHPLRRTRGKASVDPMLRVFQAVDRAVGDILAARPDANVVLFSPEGMEANAVDLPSTVFLPELLYRFSCEPAVGLVGGGRSGSPPPPPSFPKALGWHRELYALRSDVHPVRRRLRRWLPMELSGWWERASDPGPGPAHPGSAGELFHQPAMWYRPHWHRMRCFALPSISHGYVRINVRGRERDGMVPPDEYGSLCDELGRHLRALRDARTGRPLVREVVRTRRSPLEGGSRPDADLVVFYHPAPTDVVDSPRFGRIGPVPFARTGGHANRGFALLKAPGFEPGAGLPQGSLEDLAPTLLHLLETPAASGRAACPRR